MTTTAAATATRQQKLRKQKTKPKLLQLIAREVKACRVHRPVQPKTPETMWTKAKAPQGHLLLGATGLITNTFIISQIQTLSQGTRTRKTMWKASHFSLETGCFLQVLKIIRSLDWKKFKLCYTHIKGLFQL